MHVMPVSIFNCNQELVVTKYLICRSAGISKWYCFFLGSITSLHNHIARFSCFKIILLICDICSSNLGHVKIYTECCKKLGIAVNEHVYTKLESLESIGAGYIIVCFNMPKLKLKLH